MAVVNATLKGRIEGVNALTGPWFEDGPFPTADGYVVFVEVALSGTYASADGIKLTHTGSSDLLKRFGISWAKVVWLTCGTTAGVNTGKFRFEWDETNQLGRVFKVGAISTGPLDEVEMNSASLTGVKLYGIIVGT